MSRQRSASLLPILVCLALGGCATPGDTQADYVLQGDIQEIINANELARGHIFGGRVVDTKVVAEEAGTLTEHWYVKRGSHEVIYTVTLTPSPYGGTDIRVELPAEDRQ